MATIRKGGKIILTGKNALASGLKTTTNKAGVVQATTTNTQYTKAPKVSSLEARAAQRAADDAAIAAQNAATAAANAANGDPLAAYRDPNNPNALRSTQSPVINPALLPTPQAPSQAPTASSPQEALLNFQSGKWTAEQYNQWVANPNAQQPATQPTTQPAGQQPTQGAQTPQGYTGPSVVDYLSSTGQPSDFASRSKLAQQLGIQGYTGTVQQNTQLLNSLRTQEQTQQPGQQQDETPGEAPAGEETLMGVEPQGDPSTVVPTSADVWNQLGLPANLTATSIDDVVKKISQAFGLPEVTKQMTDLDDKFADDIQEVNQNPWISEGQRARNVSAIQSKYETKKDSLIDRLKLEQDVVGKAIEVYQNEKEYQKDIMFKSLTLKQGELELARDKNQQDFENNLALQKFSLEALKGTAPTADIEEYNFARSQGYGGSFLDYQKAAANLKATAGGIGGLTAAQRNSTVNSIAGAFDTEQIVKDYNQASSQVQLMQSIGTGTSNPGDDIAYVYAFAKLMDPNSVVREGEYATIQKYAQSLLNKTTLDAIRVAKNTNFLTQDAKQKLLTTAQAKMKVLGNQYIQLRSEYQRQMNDAASGSPRQLTNYTVAPSTTPPSDDNDPLGIR